MNVVIWILAGAVLGASANALMRTSNLTGIAQNVVTGIAGVLSGGWLLGVLTKTPAFIQGEFNPAVFVVSLMGATVLLTGLQVFRGRRPGKTATRSDKAPASLATSGRATTTHMRELT